MGLLVCTGWVLMARRFAFFLVISAGTLVAAYAAPSIRPARERCGDRSLGQGHRSREPAASTVPAHGHSA